MNSWIDRENHVSKTNNNNKTMKTYMSGKIRIYVYVCIYIYIYIYIFSFGVSCEPCLHAQEPFPLLHLCYFSTDKGTQGAFTEGLLM
jgi:hypothetical protein